jgi:hypothetical protein
VVDPISENINKKHKPDKRIQHDSGGRYVKKTQTVSKEQKEEEEEEKTTNTSLNGVSQRRKTQFAKIYAGPPH